MALCDVAEFKSGLLGPDVNLPIGIHSDAAIKKRIFSFLLPYLRLSPFPVGPCRIIDNVHLSKSISPVPYHSTSLQ
jgi:hypothetical protein